MSTYEEKRQARIERYQDRADKAARLSERAYKHAHDRLQMIPMGQPILVGHHSEKRHRADLKRIDNAMARSSNLQDKAQYWKQRASSAESNRAISSDDPDATKKLKIKLAKLERDRELAKNANKIVRSKKLNNEDKIKQLMELLLCKSSTAAKLLEPDFCGRYGFPDYYFSNAGGNIRRIRQRITDLEKLDQQSQDHDGSEATEFGDIKLIQNYDENRTQIEFPGKPSDDVRSQLKRSGFRWSRANGVWQRHLSNQATYLAQKIIRSA